MEKQKSQLPFQGNYATKIKKTGKKNQSQILHRPRKIKEITFSFDQNFFQTSNMRKKNTGLLPKSTIIERYPNFQ